MKDYFWHYYFPMRKGILDDAYFFMTDGRIIHLYDKTIQKLNLTGCVTAQQIAEDKKQIMYNECPAEHKDRVKEMLEL